MTDEHWDSEISRSLQVYLDGNGFTVPDDRGEPIVDDTFLLIFHAAPEDARFRLPALKWGKVWTRVLDTERGFAEDKAEHHEAGSEIEVIARSVWLLRRTT